MLFLVLIFPLVVSGQYDFSDRIDYKKFDKKLFDSLFFVKVNQIRTNNLLLPLVFDTICQKVSDYQSKYLLKNKNYEGYNTNELDSVLLITPQDRYDYFNMLDGISLNKSKRFPRECNTGLIVGLNSKTFTYEKLVNWFFDELIDDDYKIIITEDMETIENFGAFSTSVQEIDNYGFLIVVSGLIVSR